ncbi:MAG: T9SS type A sorting domain-containing protein [Bacteroidales bacterium]|nr:T9SS type A sorting domain-containing protein [Bacteroidales bacterium]
MKKIVILLIGCSHMGLVNAQALNNLVNPSKKVCHQTADAYWLPDTLVYGYYSYETDDIVFVREVCTYNQKGNLVLKEKEVQSNTIWVKLQKNVYTYDNEDRLVHMHYFEWEEDWVEIERYAYTYSENDLVVIETYEMFEDNMWKMISKTITEYDENHNEVSLCNCRWNMIQWDTVKLYLMKYDAKNNLLENVTYSYAVSPPKESYKYEYIYDTNGNILSETFTVDGEPYEQYLYTYDENENMLLLVYQLWNQNKWVNNFKIEYTNNALGNKLFELKSDWLTYSSQWKENWKASYDYVENTVSVLYMDKTATDWENSSQLAIIYNDYGSLLSRTRQVWLNDNWYNDFKEEYVYDMYNNAIEAKYFGGLQANTWRELNGDLTMYYNNSLSAINNYCHSIAVHYINKEKLSLPEVVKNNIQCFPNPTNTQLWINGLQGNEIIQLYDLSGRLLKQYPSFQNELQLDVSYFENGIYVLTIKNDTQSISKKIIVHAEK